MNQIRPATAADLEACLRIIAQAQAYFCRAGVDQWQDGYPDVSILRSDIVRGASYLIVDAADAVRATFMTAVESDPNYAAIDGAWRTRGMPYAVLHRIAIDEAVKGAGLAGMAVAFAAQNAADSAASLRADTHADNAAMRRMLKKNGFVYCGRITLANGAPRVAYEKLLP